MTRCRIPLTDRVRYLITCKNRTENYYRLQYEHLFAKHFSKKSGCLKIGDLKFPQISRTIHPTREDAYYAMEIGDILYPGLFESYKFVDEGPYEWKDIEVEPGDIVFDCGANLGIFSLYAAYRGAHVYAFEPIAEARKWIRKCCELNLELADQIDIIPVAVSDNNGTAEFIVLENTLVGSSMVLQQQGRKEMAKTVTIDTFCKEQNVHPTFIKADIEGAERLMLAGARKTLANAAPKLSICTYHFPDDKQVLKELILNANPEYKIIDKWKKYYANI